MSAHDILQTQLFEAWRTAQVADGYSEHTIKRHLYNVGQICRHALLVDPRALTTDDVRKFLADRHDLAPSTRRIYLSGVRKFAAWAKILDPTQDIRRPQRGARRPKPISEADREALLTFLRTHCRPMYVATMLGLYAGLRAFEIGSLRAEHILIDPDGSGGLLTVYNGKGRKTADVYIDRFLIDELRPEIETGGYMMGKLVTGNNISCRFLYWAKKRAGVQVSIHQCRHWFITHTYRIKRDIIVARDQARHASSGTTEGYIASEDGAARQASRMLPGASQQAVAHLITPETASLRSDPAILRAQMSDDPEEFVDRMAQMIARYERQRAQLEAARALLHPPDTPSSS